MTQSINVSNNDEAHEYVSSFIEEAYAKKDSVRPTSAEYRSEMSDIFCEAYYVQNDRYPADTVLSRLAWYVTFGEMTDRNEHKVAHEEFPILSLHQIKLREKRERSISDVYTGKDDETIGRSRGHDGISRRIYDYMTPERDSSLIPAEYLDLYDALDNAGLTGRQRQAIDLVYFGGMTQGDAAKEMGVSHRRIVGKYCDVGITKLGTYMRNIG